MGEKGSFCAGLLLGLVTLSTAGMQSAESRGVTAILRHVYRGNVQIPPSTVDKA
jgi:hypothetical protein